MKEGLEHYALVHLDDYFKKAKDAPRVGEQLFWDHPDSLRFDDLHKDLLALKEGRPITVMTRSELYNPEYRKELKNKLEYTILPKSVIIVEGYLAFFDVRIRALMDVRIYLEFPIERSLERRTKFMDEKYFRELLIPAHEEFVKPTKAHATLIIDVQDKGVEEVVQEARTHIAERLRGL